MNNIFKKSKLLICLLLISAPAFSQKLEEKPRTEPYYYQTALGIKGLFGAGITFKTFIHDNKALECIGFFWNQGTRITGLYEVYNPFEDVERLRWYYGFGVHFTSYNKAYYNGESSMGLDGVLGLDYKIKNAPFDISIDWQPTFEFNNMGGFIGGWGGLGLRYVIK